MILARKLVFTTGAALLAISVLSGCSTFKSSRRLDLAPFSENSGVMFSDAAKVSRPFQYNYLRPYLDAPEMAFVLKRTAPLLQAFRGVVYYSNQVVAIGNSKLSASDKNRQLVHYLEQVFAQSAADAKLDSLGLDEETMNATFDNIRNAKTYLDGIAAASPIINAVVVAIQNRLDEVQYTLVPAMAQVFETGIERDYASARDAYIELKHVQVRSVRALNSVYDAKLGNAAALVNLLDEDPSLRTFIPSPEKATPKELDDAEKYLLERLANISTVFRQLDDDVANYKAKQAELGEWRLNLDEKIKVARNAMMVWAQSHRNLGNGIPVPPMIDVGGIAGGLVGGAKKTVF
jgi:hypothetical protein